MLGRILRLALTLPLIIIMIAVVVVNVNLSYTPEKRITDGDTIDYELLKELMGLENAMDQHADIDMQNIFPEGYIFLNALYALSWSSFLQAGSHSSLVNEGRAEMHKAWLKIASSTGKASFSEELSLPYGAFYNGWSSYVLGSKLRIENEGTRDKTEIDQFKQQCAAISSAIQQKTYPVSYYGLAWPADVMLCVASLSLHDKLFEPQYKVVIDRWVTEVKRQTDAHGMIPHAVHPGNGRVVEGARGSSLALMLIFLREIDDQLATEQFMLFKEKFIDTKFGLTGVREYPKGESGIGDIDSGPVLFGFGGAATIVGMQTLSCYGEHELGVSVRNGVEALAFPWQTEDAKHYFFGVLPMADAFIAWSHSNMDAGGATVSFLRFRVYSILIFIFLSMLFWTLIRVKRGN